jgi:hypothetical protein
MRRDVNDILSLCDLNMLKSTGYKGIGEREDAYVSVDRVSQTVRTKEG